MSGEEPDLKLVEQVRRRLAGLARDWTPMDVAHAILDCGRVASCLLYTSPSPRDVEESRMPSSA